MNTKVWTNLFLKKQYFPIHHKKSIMLRKHVLATTSCSWQPSYVINNNIQCWFHFILNFLVIINQKYAKVISSSPIIILDALQRFCTGIFTVISFMNRYFDCCTIEMFPLQNKSKLVTYVVASALSYGAEEHIFHYLFKVRAC